MKTFYQSTLSLIFISLIFFNPPLSSQDIIHLSNPSFEDVPRKGGQDPLDITGWYDCGRIRYPGESPPDIHPLPYHAWGVTTKAYDGKTYLSLVTRYNGTYEAVAQRLSLPLEADSCYSFSVMMAKDDNYNSPTQRSRHAEPESFTEPVLLQIWGTKDYCNYIELIGRSEPVRHSNWIRYDFVLWPSQSLNYISLEAFYEENTLEAYNGHILIDSMSPIVKIPCK